MGATVLVVEDQAQIRELVRRYLERAGYAVLSTASGAEALTLISAGCTDLAVVDLRLPDVPGEEVLSAATAERVPVVVLSGLASAEDRIRGLERGADDYVTKPFSPRELVLRVRAVLHRAGGQHGDADVISYGDGLLRLDHGRHEVTVAGRPVELTPTEWRLLAALAEVPGRVYSRFELANRTRGSEFAGDERTVDSHVRNLRRKLNQRPGEVRLIATVLGVGYRLAVPRDD